jgi:hypothetical protein
MNKNTMEAISKRGEPEQNHISPDELIRLAIDHYLHSDDFKGLPISRVPALKNQSIEKIKTIVQPLIEQGQLTVRCNSVDVNPFIKRMPDLPIDKEIIRLNKWDGGVLTIYPTRTALEHIVNREVFLGRPFSLEMALGDAWLDFRTFELGVLEQYRNDPRYYYRVNDVSGYISVHDEHYLGKEMKESDKVLLRHFGFAYDDSMN